MAQVRVAISFLHETDEPRARQELVPDSVVSAGGYIVGDIEEEKLADLQNEGLAVQKLPAEQPEDWEDLTRASGVNLISRSAAGEQRLAVSGGGADEAHGDAYGAGAADFGASPELAPDEPATWAIQVNGPLLDSWRKELAARGLDIVERVTRSGYLARGTAKAANEATAQSFVQRLDRAALAVPEPAPAPAGFGGAGFGGAEAVAFAPTVGEYDIVLDGTVSAEDFVAALRARGVEIEAYGTRRVRARCPGNDPLLLDQTAQKGVLAVSPYIEPQLFNDRVATLLGIAPPVPGVQGLDGTNQIVAITDTGIDDTHPDFAGKLMQVTAHGRVDDSSDPAGHGTHVAGSIVGTGAASDGAIRGIAPGAKLIFQSVLDAAGGLGGLRNGLHDLLQAAYDAGARVHNHSWGAVSGSEYQANSVELDAFAWEHPETLLVVAAGNEGTASHHENVDAGFVDLFSVCAPGTAKNVLTVGAACSDRTDGSMANRSWNAFDAARFPNGDVGQGLVSGDPQRLAGFSSRGPCRDHRVKPDVVAPGTDILSTRSALAPDASFWGNCQSNAKYAYMGGTSMAAPIAAGMAALVRQWYVQERHVNPSGALLKATLINGTRWLTGRDAQSSNGNSPNVDQGFGELHLPTTIPLGADPPFGLQFVDTIATPALKLSSISESPVKIKVNVGAGVPLRACLCYFDAPRRATQNDLQLLVGTPDNKAIFGNANRRTEYNGTDADNNVEMIYIEKPTPGEHIFTVTAMVIMEAPQGFALVITGDLQSQLAITRF